MLALMATLAAEVAGIATRAMLAIMGASDRVRVLSFTLLLVALLSGLLTLGLTPVTLKLRRTAPPRAIVVAAVIIGLIPLMTLFLLWMREFN
jgi:hypothetical protein